MEKYYATLLLLGCMGIVVIAIGAAIWLDSDKADVSSQDAERPLIGGNVCLCCHEMFDAGDALLCPECVAQMRAEDDGMFAKKGDA